MLIKRFLLSILALVAVLVAVLAINTLRQPSRQLEVPPAPAIAVDADAAAQHLAAAVRLRTVSSIDDAQLNLDQFQALHEHLRATYPRVHSSLQREVVNGLSLLYTWPGSDPKAKPILLMAHQDVVPIAPGTEGDWSEPPFSGNVKGGFVWGRGAWDDKGNLIAELEAVESLLAGGFRPRRTIYLAFGADEEVGGLRGAAHIARLLAARGVKLDFVVDEGLLITEGAMPGLTRPVALIGIAEKGFTSVTLSASATPGHSSMPPPPGRSAIGIMSGALERLDERPFPAEIRGVAREMFDTLAPEMNGFNRVALSNLWLFGPIVRKQLEALPSGNAMLRTTTALTVVHAGNKDNVLPGRAEAIVNFRILQGDTRAAVLQHVKETVADERVRLGELASATEASPISPTQSDSYRLIHKTVRELFPGTVVAPGLMIGGTDSRHFEAVSEHIYRFSPVYARPEDLARFHGTNERIATRNLADLIRFYRRLLEQGAGAP
ncbi:MAG TPA: M20 family peptidase [Albitalea sp.]|nr:M20 family peptidase [Albitalea sp.]